MTNIKRFHIGKRLSETAVHNGTCYLAGQTEEVLGVIDGLLSEAGSSKSHILMTTIYLADLADFDGMNAVWDAWVDQANVPPRATVQAQLARPDWRIEVVVTAAVH